jgi:hypothetical protein
VEVPGDAAGAHELSAAPSHAADDSAEHQTVHDLGEERSARSGGSAADRQSWTDVCQLGSSSLKEISTRAR